MLSLIVHFRKRILQVFLMPLAPFTLLIHKFCHQNEESGNAVRQHCCLLVDCCRRSVDGLSLVRPLLCPLSTPIDWSPSETQVQEKCCMDGINSNKQWHTCKSTVQRCWSIMVGTVYSIFTIPHFDLRWQVKSQKLQHVIFKHYDCLKCSGVLTVAGLIQTIGTKYGTIIWDKGVS